jgi:hypothetical protein
VIVEEPVVSEDYHNTDIQSTKEENDDVITVTHQVIQLIVMQTDDQLIYLAAGIQGGKLCHHHSPGIHLIGLQLILSRNYVTATHQVCMQTG